MTKSDGNIFVVARWVSETLSSFFVKKLVNATFLSVIQLALLHKSFSSLPEWDAALV